MVEHAKRQAHLCNLAPVLCNWRVGHRHAKLRFPEPNPLLVTPLHVLLELRRPPHLIEASVASDLARPRYRKDEDGE